MPAAAPSPASARVARNSHVVARTRQTSALRGTADTLLDADSFGVRWVLLSPAPGAAPRLGGSGPPLWQTP